MPEFFLTATALVFMALPLSAMAQASPPTLADRLSTMDAQVLLVRKQLELDQALTVSAGSALGTMPRVVAIYGWEPKLQARLLLSGGTVFTFQEGETIRAGMRVASITSRAVLVSVRTGNRTSTVPLEFVQSAMPTGGAAPGLPPGLPGGAQPSPLPPELLPLPPALGMPLPGVPWSKADAGPRAPHSSASAQRSGQGQP